MTPNTATSLPDAPTQALHLDAAPGELDRAVHQRLAGLTMGLSPASMAVACTDWLGHLAISPGKMQALMRRAAREAAAAGLPAKAVEGGAAQTPLVKDPRFAAPEWRQWPFDQIAAGFLRSEAWWQDATTSVEGVSAHHELMAAFMARQVLDMLSPSNFAATNPEILALTVKSGGANLAQGAQHAWRDMADKLGGAAGATAAEGFLPGRDVAVTPGKVVLRNELIELIQYTPQTATVFAEPVLIVPPWIMKFYILDLSPQDSLVRYLVERGHTVFIISWVNPDAAESNIGMGDYLKWGVMAAVDAVSRIVPRAKIQAVGYCLGGTLLSIAAAAMARSGDQRLSSLSLLAAEVDFTEPGALSMFIDDSQLAVLDDTMEHQGYLDGAQMAGAFMLLNSRDLLWSHLVQRYLMGRSDPVSDLGAWNADATRMPYRQHSQYLHALYRDNDLAAGRYRVDGKPVALPDIRVPIFLLGTQRDTVAPWRSVYKLHLLTHGELTFCLSSGGHNVGIVNPPELPAGAQVHRSYQLGVRGADDNYTDPDTWFANAVAHEGSWWPAWEAWLRQHAGGRRVAPPGMGDPLAPEPVLDDAPGRYVLVR